MSDAEDQLKEIEALLVAHPEWREGKPCGMEDCKGLKCALCKPPFYHILKVLLRTIDNQHLPSGHQKEIWRVARETAAAQEKAREGWPERDKEYADKFGKWPKAGIE